MGKFRPLLIIRLAAVLGGLLLAFNNCDIQQPSVASGFSSVGYTHTGFEVSCAECHESIRPAVLTSGVLHGNGADCVSCHASTNTPNGTNDVVWTSLVLSTLTNQSYTHTAGLNSCVDCHSPNRPAPVNSFVHYNNNDCVSCHSPDSDTNGLTQAQINSDFNSSYAYTHPAGLPKCAICHEKDRFNAQHNPGQDCVTCHGTNDTWTPSLTLGQIQAIWNSTSH